MTRWSTSGAGIETARLPDGGILVRAAGDVNGPVLRYTRAEIDAFVRGAKDGEFDDLAGPCGFTTPGGVTS
jgi:hypothetical protein